MALERIRVWVNPRTPFDINFVDNTAFLVGMNGTGKTWMLDRIHNAWGHHRHLRGFMEVSPAVQIGSQIVHADLDKYVYKLAPHTAAVALYNEAAISAGTPPITDGLRRLPWGGLGRMIRILSVAATYPSDLVLIDEPERGLHVHWQTELMRMLGALHQGPMVLATHSPYIIGHRHAAMNTLGNRVEPNAGKHDSRYTSGDATGIPEIDEAVYQGTPLHQAIQQWHGRRTNSNTAQARPCAECDGSGWIKAAGKTARRCLCRE